MRTSLRQILLALLATAATATPNRVLDLDGVDGAVRLPPGLFGTAESVTVEAWVRWRGFNSFSQPFGFGRAWQGMFLNNRHRSADLQLYVYDGEQNLELIQVPDILQLDRWHHVAAVFGTGGMRLYLNGVLVGQLAETSGLGALGETPANLLGGPHWEDNEPFDGQLDEVRVWDHARTADEVRAGMHARLAGVESGLLGLWDFDGGDARDATPRRQHGELVGGARTVLVNRPAPVDEAVPSTVWGQVRDATGRPLPNARLRLHVAGNVQREALSDLDGFYSMSFYGARCDLDAVHGELGVWLLDVPTPVGRTHRLDVILRRALSVSGRLRAPDGSPHVGIPVQAVRLDDAAGGGVRALTVRSAADGSYRFVNLRPGRYEVRCLTSSGAVSHDRSVVVAPEGSGESVGFRLPPFKSGFWRTFDYESGLGIHAPTVIEPAADGGLWLGTYGGVYHFDGHGFRRPRARHDLPSDVVHDLYEDVDSSLWIATAEGLAKLRGNRVVRVPLGLDAPVSVTGICRGSGGELWLATRAGLLRCAPDAAGATPCSQVLSDALFGEIVHALSADPAGLWLGTSSGLMRYSGGDLVRFPDPSISGSQAVFSLLVEADGSILLGTANGLSLFRQGTFSHLLHEGPWGRAANALLRDGSGRLWVGTVDGLLRLDHPHWPTARERKQGLRLTGYTVADGLAAGAVHALHQGDDGILWVATASGLSRFSERTVSTFKTAHGLPHNSVTALRADPRGGLWIGTRGGLGRLADGAITSFTTADGLPENPVHALGAAADGGLWIGLGVGISHLGSEGFTNITARQGLLGNVFSAIATDRRGRQWFGSHGYGVYVHDGNGFERRVLRGDPSRTIHAVLADGDSVWVGGNQGLTRLGPDGDERTYTATDGLAGTAVFSLYRDPQGPLWIGTDRGVSRFDGSGFVPVTAEEFGGGAVFAIERFASGLLGIGTASGLSLYDGEVWTVLDRRDGLAGNVVRALAPAGDEALWVGTEGGLTRLRLGGGRPAVRVVSVLADTLHVVADGVPTLRTGTRATVRYASVDLQTRPGRHRYRRRLQTPGSPASPWEPTASDVYDITFERPGVHVFEVEAVNSSLRRSPVARLELLAELPWHADPLVTGAFALVVGSLLLSSVFYGRRSVRQQRETRRLREDMLHQEREARREVEAAYQQVQRLLSQEERAAVILRGWAHAVKSPLTIIRRELEAGGPSSPDLPERVSAIVATVDRMLGAAVDLQYRTFDLRAELNLLLYRMVQRFDGVELLPSEGGGVSVRADHAKLTMAFENLFLNACQAASEGAGHVTLEIEIEVDGNAVAVRVRDDGPGIDADVLGRLFEHTVTTRKDRGGTGLGLLIARHVIEAHGGSIRVLETSAAGTCIAVQLPALPTAAPEDDQQRRSTP